jgi:hypothetical protein
MAYSKKTRFFLLIYFIKIYNLYFLFLYIIANVKIRYKRKKIHFFFLLIYFIKYATIISTDTAHVLIDTIVKI